MNTSLIGTYAHNLDEKGRLAVPSKLRIELGDPFYIVRLNERCLTAFPEEEWHKFAGKLSAIPQSDTKAQRAVRMIFSSACKCEPDKQGRILLPQLLREKAGIDKEVVMIGAYTRAEIWAREKWAEFEEEKLSGGSDFVAGLAEYGI
ncbi:MAG: division/cell wall cluster transcriptional repressor MraZ [Christensenellales bacterium]